jgi:hypothetical protein
VEAVAKAPEFARIGSGDQRLEVRQRGGAVIGRQELAETRKPACLFEMEIGHDQRAPPRPEQRALRQRHEFLTGERKGNHGLL